MNWYQITVHTVTEAVEAISYAMEEMGLGKDRICQIHCTDTDGVTLPYNTRLDMNAVKHTLDKMGRCV